MKWRHGHAVDGQNTPEYRAWGEMKARCLNPKKKGYVRYGGAGVAICKEWLHDFSAFLRDVGPRPTSSHSLDRHPNNDGNYEPRNVRWATRREQMANRKNTRFVVVDGKKTPLSEVIRDRGLNRRLVCSRVENGWPPERAISTPSAKNFGVSQSAVSSIKRGEWK